MGFTKKNYQEIRDAILDDVVGKGLITDRNAGGVARTLVEAYARELATLNEALQNVYDAAFVDTATGKSLEYVVSILGIQRIEEEQAVGTVVLSRQTAAAGDITIPAGTVVTRPRKPGEERPPLFTVTESRTLREGEKTVELTVRASEPGITGVVEAGELTVLPRPIVGIEAAVNREKTTLRVRRETDEELRQRAKNALRNTGKATEDALVFAIRQLGAQSVEIVDRPRGLAGEIEVIVDDKALDDEERIRAFENAINDTKAAGIRARLRVTERIHLFLKLRLTLKDAGLVQDELDTLLEKVRERVEAYVAGLGPGDSVRRNGVISAVLADGKVTDVEFLPPDDTTPGQLIKTGRIVEGKRDFESAGEIEKRLLPGGDIFMGGEERAVLEKETDLIPLRDLLVREVRTPVFADFSDPGLVLSGDSKVSREQILHLIEENIKRFLEEINRRRETDKRDLTLEYQALRSALAIEGYTLASSALRVVLLHTSDGLENTLAVAGQRDMIRAGERVELKNLDLRVNVVSNETS